MTEIEKMKRYIERTKLNENDRFYLDTEEAFELAIQAHKSNDLPLNTILLAFNYGKAKGFRAAKAERRAAGTNMVTLPTMDQTKREAALDRDVEAIVDAFRELHEVERMTGRTGLSARVRLSIMNVIMSADKVAVS